MILEYAQLLSTAHRVLDGSMSVGLSETGRKRVSYDLPDSRELSLYRATHINHPSAVWVRKSSNNYAWLYTMWKYLLDEYTVRYGKIHAAARLIGPLFDAPKNIPIGEFTQPTPAMPDEYKVAGDSIQSYHNYYVGSKHEMSRWTNSYMPQWFIDGINKMYDQACYIFTDKQGRIVSTSTIHI